MAKLDKYNNLVSNILDMVGGKDNVSLFTNCLTRLRFNLKDKGLVQLEKIEATEGVIGAQWSGDQLQIIIGQNVNEVYDMICKAHKMKKEDSINEDLDGVKKNLTVKGVISSVVDGIAGSLTPLIPMLIGGGMIRVIAMIIQLTGILPADNPTYMILNWLGDAFLYYLPVFVGYTGARKFGANPYIGMLLGALLIHPNFMGAISGGTALTIFGLPVYAGSYKSTVFPMIVTTWILSLVEKPLKKYSPEMLKSMLVPTLSLLIMLPIMLAATAPLGFYLGVYVSSAIIWLYETFGFFGIAIWAALKPIITLTGMHLGTTPYMINQLSTYGYEPFNLPTGFINNFNQAAACFAVSFKTKNKNLKGVALSSGISALVPGVSEPAMFAVTVKYKKPMLAVMIGNFVAGAITGLLSVAAYSLPGSAALFGLMVFIGPNNNLLKFVIACIIGMVVTFAATLVLGFDDRD